VPEIPVNQLDV